MADVFADTTALSETAYAVKIVITQISIREVRLLPVYQEFKENLLATKRIA